MAPPFVVDRVSMPEALAAGKRRRTAASVQRSLRGSGHVDVEAIADRLWPGRPVTAVALGVAGTRHNVRVILEDGESFVLRGGGPDAELLGIARNREHEASLAAAAVGVGPEVVDFLDDLGVVVTRWIEGELVTEERMREPQTLRRVAQALRAVHAGPPLPGRFDSFRIVEEYRSAVFSYGASVPSAYAWARQVARRVESARGRAPERPCHNDLIVANVVDDGARLRIVDWEYAGMGDVFFDLACVAVHNDLDVELREVLVEAYAGSLRPHDVRSLELMRFMSEFREAMWALAQGAAGATEHDFAARAERHFERLARIADEPSFESALG
jgi:thiamine kinase-like enzyme